ncbi:MAG: diketogulonate reductase-like aldo/keto reductase [Psychromonas sp.]|jgi:diketogulonate reductase-like aldo/keto reductase
MEKLIDQKLVKEIGVCNYNSALVQNYSRAFPK